MKKLLLYLFLAGSVLAQSTRVVDTNNLPSWPVGSTNIPISVDSYGRVVSTGGGGGGGGTVTSVSVTTANGVSGSVATATTTPAISLTLGDITPSSVVATGSIATGSGGTTAGALALGQGTAPSTGTTNVTLYAPTSVTSWKGRLPGVAASGVLQGTNTAGDVVFGFSTLTSGRVTFATTNGLLSDDADMTFATDTLTVTKIIGSTSITDSGLTSGRVTFASTSGLLADSAVLLYASGLLSVNNATASNPAAITGTYFHITGPDATAPILLIDSLGAVNPSIVLRNAAGTSASPTATQSGSGIGIMAARGYGATGYAASGTAAINFIANQNFTDSAMGTKIVFETTPDASVTRATALTIGADKSLTVAGNFVFNSTTYTAAAATGVGYIGMPQNSQSAAYTTVLTDQGKHILHPTADNNARTITIDSNANVAYPIGTVITVVNQINTVTIAITSDTLTWFAGSGTASTGSRTLAAGGVATLLKVGTTSWIISGPGVS